MRITAFLVIFIGCFGVSVMGKCHKHWIPHGTYCYRFNHRPATYCQAQTFCQIHGGYVAEPRDHCQNMFVSWIAHKRRSWIGLTDLSKEKVFRWHSNGHFLGKVHSWAVGEPNNYKNQEHCTETNFRRFAKWNDISCNARFPFVCQKKKH